MRFKFFKTALIIAFIATAILAYPLYAWAAPNVLEAVVAAGIIALANVIAGAAIIEFSIDKPNGLFMGATFGGMFARMVAILIAFAILVTNGYDRMALTFALMSFYLLFMVAEFVYITRELTRRKARSRYIARSRATSRSRYKDRVSPRMASAEYRSN